MQNSDRPRGGDTTHRTPPTPEQTRLAQAAKQERLTFAECVRRVDAGEDVHHAAALFSDRPAIAAWDPWLTAFSSDFPPRVQYDAEATAFLSSGLILLTALVADSRNAERIAEATTYPVAFVWTALDQADQTEIWTSFNARLLRTQLTWGETSDHQEINTTLLALAEDYWMAIPDGVTAMLVSLRAGHQSGGCLDDWTKVEDVSFRE